MNAPLDPWHDRAMRTLTLLFLLACCGAPPSAAKCIAAHPEGNSQARLGLNDCGTGPCRSQCGATIWGSGSDPVTDSCAACVVSAIRAGTCSTAHCPAASDCGSLLICLGG